MSETTKFEFTLFRKNGSPYKNKEEIVESFRKSLSFSDSLELWGVTVTDAETIVCITGNGPESEESARKITDALNHLVNQIPPGL